MKILVRLILVVNIALMQGACSTRLSPDDFEAQNFSLPQLKSVPSATLKAALSGTKDKVLPLAGFDVIVNEDEFAGELVKRLKLNLEGNGVKVQADSPNILEIRTTHVELQPDRTIYCVIDFDRKLGNGEVRGFQARSKNWNYETACDEALNQAVKLILNDAATLDYLRGQ